MQPLAVCLRAHARAPVLIGHGSAPLSAQVTKIRPVLPLIESFQPPKRQKCEIIRSDDLERL